MRNSPTLWLALLLASCTPSPKRVTVHAPGAISILGNAPTAPAPRGAHWEPFDAPPDALSVRVTLHRGLEEIRFDSGYTRWLFDNFHTPKRAAGIQEQALAAVAWLEQALVATTEDGQLLVADEPLGPWRTLINSAAPTRLLGTYQQTLTIAHAGKVGILPGIPRQGKASEIHWLEEFEGRTVLDARLDAAGKGLVMFSPQRLAETSDYGHTYKPLSDSGIFAKELRVDGQRVVLVPGGEHDVFARSYTPGSGKLERSLSVPENPQPYATVGDAPPWLPTDIDTSLEKRTNERFSMGTSTPKFRAFAADADDLVVLGSNRLLEFTLGHPVPKTRWEKSLGKATHVTACGGTFVAGFDKAVFVRHGQEDWHMVELDIPVDKQSYGGNRLQSLTMVTPRHLVFRVGANAYVIDLTSPKTSQRFVAFKLMSGELSSTCSQELPAEVWLSSNHRRSASFVVDPNQTQAVTTKPLAQASLTWNDRWIADLDDGAQLFLTPKGLVRVDRLGMVETMKLPGASPLAAAATSDKSKGIAFNREGRGIYIEPSTGNVWQSLDGARTFTRTQGLGRALDGKSVFCTRNRCEVENEVVRVGWDNPTSQTPQPSLATKGILHIQCGAAKPLSLPKGLAATAIGEPAARLDSQDWVAGVMDSTSRPNPEESMSVIGPYTDNRTGFIAERSGALEYYPLHKWLGPEAASGVLVYSGRSIAGLISFPGNGGAGMSGQLSVETWLIPDAPHQPPRKLNLHPGEFGYAYSGFSLMGGGLVSRDGAAFVDSHSRRLFLLDRHGTVTQRNWAGTLEPGLSRPTIERLTDGTLLSVSRDTGWLELLSIDPDGYVHESTIALAPSRELGVGILNEAGKVFVVMPVDRGSEHSLWRFPIDAQWHLGAGELYGEGTPQAKGLLAFQACKGTPKGATYFEISVPHVQATVDGKDWQGVLRRTLRIAPSTGAASPDALTCLANSEYFATEVGENNAPIPTSLKILWNSPAEAALVWQSQTGASRATCSFESPQLAN